MDELAQEIGVKPDLMTLFKSDPALAARCLFGPCIPAQYRLQGPGKWAGAKEAITNAMNRSLAPMKTRILPKNHCCKPTASKKCAISLPHALRSYVVLAFVFFLFFSMCVV